MRKNGFTLIELMAIIIILGLIAAIVVPGTSRMIEKAKQKTAVDSTYGYVETFEKNSFDKLYEIENEPVSLNGKYSVTGSKLERDDSFSFEIEGRNLNTITGEIEVNSKGKIAIGYFVIGKYEIYYDGVRAVCTGLVVDALAREVKLDQNVIVEKGSSIKINAQVFPTYAKDKSLTWSTSDPELATVDQDGNVTAVNSGDVDIIATTKNGIVGVTTISISPIPFVSGEIVKVNTLYDFISNPFLINSGEYTISLTSKGTSILAEVYVVNEDTIYSTNPTLCDTVPDVKMCIYKYMSNLTINTGVTVTPVVRKKGFSIYVAGALNNSGVISMTARGATAVGMDLPLFQNTDGTVEFIPAIGGSGGLSVAATSANAYGKAGSNGQNRGSGGGGSGAVYTNGCGGSDGVYGKSGAGGSGTAFSGGSGGGGVVGNGGTLIGGDGSSVGGAGGQAKSSRYDCGTYVAGGGAGNPAGTCVNVAGDGGCHSGVVGTGGLLNIFTDSLINNGSIVSNGSSGGYGYYSRYNSSTGWNGGASGGGSINIFYKTSILAGTITSNGATSLQGGKGGNGAISVGSISTGKYISD